MDGHPFGILKGIHLRFFLKESMFTLFGGHFRHPVSKLYVLLKIETIYISSSVA